MISICNSKLHMHYVSAFIWFIFIFIIIYFSFFIYSAPLQPSPLSPLLWKRKKKKKRRKKERKKKRKKKVCDIETFIALGLHIREQIIHDLSYITDRLPTYCSIQGFSPLWNTMTSPVGVTSTPETWPNRTSDTGQPDTSTGPCTQWHTAVYTICLQATVCSNFDSFLW